MNVRKGLRRLSVTAAVLALAWAAVPMLAADRPAASPGTCTVVDTDAGLDDFRALTVLVPARDVRAVVVTEGISGVRNGATAVSMLLAARGDLPRVLPGFASPAPPDYDWLPAARAGAERLNTFLHDAVPAAGDPARLGRDVKASLSGCHRVDLLVLGPWTSYPHYARALGHDVHVTASGRSFAENNPDNFNCEYDLAACRTAAPRHAVYVDLPTPGADLTYDPTEAMIGSLDQAGLPGLLRAALLADPSQWLGTRLWDDAAALQLLAPGAFARQGRHLEPAVGEDAFRDLVVHAIDAG
jgi:hypothetical protein